MEILELQKQLKKSTEDLGKAAKELHEKQDSAEAKNETFKGEFKSYQEKVNADITKIEDEIKKISNALQAPNFQAQAKEGEVSEEQKKRVSAMDKYYRHGKGSLSNEEKSILSKVEYSDEAKATSLNEGNDREGGYLVEDDFRREIIKDIVETSPFEADVRTIMTSGRAIKAPRREQTSEAFYTGERQAIQKTDIKYSRPEIPVNKLAAIIDVTEEELADASFDLQSEFRMEFSEQFAKRKNRAIFRGDGIDKPFGIVSDSRMQASAYNNGATFLLNPDKLMQLPYQLKTGYKNKAKYYAQRLTISQMRTLKDLQGRYLWEPGLNGGQSPLFSGFPLVECPDMAQSHEASGGFTGDTDAFKEYPVLFGSLGMLYWLVERTQLSISRNPWILEENDEVRFTAKMRHGGQVVRPEAAVFLKMAV